MFKFTIRELMLLTLVAALGVAWTIDHQAIAASRDSAKAALVEVRDDAESLARFGRPFRGACGTMAGYWTEIAEKYCPTAEPEPKLVIVPEDDLLEGHY